LKFFATTPKGLELLLVEELRALGAESAAEKLAGVEFTGELGIAYQACLWSRLANRILMPLKQVSAATPEELYAGVQQIDWDEHMHPDATLHINFVTTQSNITHTLFGAQKVKDAIVDQVRAKHNTRPNVVREKPNICIHIYLNKNIASISLDLSGESLHKRGIRLEHGMAPLKENLAAAILLRSGWKAIAAENGPLIDPMCGSGTFLIEAAQIAGNIAPGLARDYFGFLAWKQHDEKLWRYLVEEAEQHQDLENLPTIIGYDVDARAIKIAFANIERAGLLGKIHVEKKELSACMPKKDMQPGLILMNPPYGERLGEFPELPKLYEHIGTKLKSDFLEWKAAIFTGNPDLGKNMGIRARKHYALFNGAIPCQLLLFDVLPAWFVDRSPAAGNERRIRKAQRVIDDTDRHAIQMFVNRLQKNMKHLKRWAERENIHSYRLYDADLPEYAVSIDRYETKTGTILIVKEYPAPKSIDKTKAERRMYHVLAVLPEVLNVDAKDIFLHARSDRYEEVPISALDNLYQANENQIHFLINAQQENLATGLPLWQRLFRSFLPTIVKDKQILNLFPRSGALSVCAALGGAASITNVDDSAFFLEWNKKNFSLNHLHGSQYQFIQANCSEWVTQQRSRYDVIIMDVPKASYRIREEYHGLIENAVRLLKADGMLVLLSSHSQFQFDSKESDVFVKDISNRFITPDFSRDSRANSVMLVRFKDML
jgi:23S rRNA (guanine2445-N2)-methyltransferase / 23S rRNA (guanine2069-N7)-methyltransferase